MRQWLVALGLLVSATAMAAPAPAPEQVIRARLKGIMPDVQVTSIRATPLPGFFEVRAQGYETVYVSGDGRFMLQGELLEVQPGKVVSLTEQSLSGERREALAKVARKDMIIFPAKGKAQGAIYAFTDVDCGYCRKLHQEVSKMNQQGIEVRYLAFPRSGTNGATARKMEAVWCAEDRLSAMTASKQGRPVVGTTSACRSPVDGQYQLGLRLGVKGTPAVFLEDGTQLGGFVTAEEVAAKLNLP